MKKISKNKIWIIGILLGLIIIGIVLRIDTISDRTIGHVETYIPNIDLPDGISIPRPRLTLAHTISRTIGEDVHPPTYYLTMYPLTKIFGTGIVTLRLPSVICGALCIFLLFLLCIYTEDKLTAILAAGMLALNGLHIYWSQEAKSYIFACFLGLLSTLLLVFIMRNGRYQRIFKILYLCVTLSGLFTLIYIWPIFLTHLFWLLWKNWCKKQPYSGLMRLQFLILILGSPILALTAYQSRRPAYIEENFLMQLFHFFQFGFIFEPDPFIESLQKPLPIILPIIVLLFAIILFIAGVTKKPSHVEQKNDTDSFLSIFIIPAGIICFLTILIFSKFAYSKDPSRIIYIIITGCVPLLLPIIDLILKKYWRQLASWNIKTPGISNILQGSVSLNTLLGIVPALIMICLSFITPLFIARGVLAFVPYLLIILARGMTSLVQKSPLWLIVVVLAISMHVLGIMHWKTRLHSPRDYKELYAKWSPQIQQSDLIFVQVNWATTPIFYYLKGDKYNFIGRDYTIAIDKHPGSRVWVICLPGIPIAPEIKDALAKYKQQNRINAFNIWTVLYEKSITDTSAFISMPAKRSTP